MTKKQNRTIEIWAFIISTIANYFLFGWYLCAIAATSIFISDFVFNRINKNKDV